MLCLDPQANMLLCFIVEQVSCAQRETEDGLDYVENQTRRNNLRIDGVAEIAA